MKVARLVNEKPLEFIPGDYQNKKVSHGEYLYISGESPKILCGIGNYKNLIITYNIENIVTLYDDCGKLQLEILKPNSNTKSKKIDIQLKFPSKADKMANVYAWKYLNNKNTEIEIKDNEKVNFSETAEAFKTGIIFKMLLPIEMFKEVTNVVEENILNEIITSERVLVEETTAREKFKNSVINVFELIILAIVIIKAFSHIQESGNIFTRKPTQKIKYTKELPYDGITPGQACFIKDVSLMKMGDVFSATLLSLKLKGVIDFIYHGNEKIFQNVYIKIINDNPELAVEEKPIFDFLLEYTKKFQREDKTISLNVLKKYIASSSQKVSKLKNDILASIKRSIPFYSQKANRRIIKKQIEIIYYIIAIIIMQLIHGNSFDFFTLYTWINILSIVNIFHCIMIATKTNAFDQIGIDYRESLRALQRYMSEFSEFKDKGLPEIALWEYYIIFAEAFGISKKVLQQIKASYPNIIDSSFSETYEACEYINMCEFRKSFLFATSME